MTPPSIPSSAGAPILSSTYFTPPSRSLRIIVVDDDEVFRESLSLHLLNKGYSVKSFANGRAALEHLASGGTADIILLEWRLPGMNGLEVLRELRRRGTMTPIIFLTALSDDIYEEVALAGGAVDFIDKSRRLSILVRRIELITGGARPTADRNQPRLPDVIQLGPLELRLDINRAVWNNQTVDLTLAEFRLLWQLALKPSEDVSYRELYDLVHGKDFVAGSGAEGYRVNVRTIIKRIRKKFRDVAPDFDEIHNYAGVGYRWGGSLRRADAGSRST
jgi:two-component system, OmpR family, response regulator ChvI